MQEKYAFTLSRFHVVLMAAILKRKYGCIPWETCKVDVAFSNTSPNLFIIENNTVEEEKCIFSTLGAQATYSCCVALVVES